MYYFVTELQTREDGIINSTITTRSSLAMGLAYYYQRAAAAVASTEFPAIALTLQDQNGTIIKNEAFDTCFGESEEEEEG